MTSTYRVSAGCPNVVPQVADLPEFTGADGFVDVGAESKFPDPEHAAVDITACGRAGFDDLDCSGADSDPYWHFDWHDRAEHDFDF